MPGDVQQKDVFKNFAKFQTKTPVSEFFFNKVTGLACNFVEKETWTQEFSTEFCKKIKTIHFVEHLRTAAFNYQKIDKQNKLCSLFFNSSERTFFRSVRKIGTTVWC